MNRELCEFYRDKGYPREWGSEFWTNYFLDNGYPEAEWKVVDFEQDDADDTGVFIAIPDIPGLLAFLNGKLCGPDSTVAMRLKFGELCRRWVNRIVDNALSMAELGDAGEMLAEDGKAALEALDDN